MKNIRTILLLSATCLTIIGAETSFASLNGASLLDYTGASATSTSICNTVTLSPKSNQKSHTHLVAASPSPHFFSLNLPQTSTLVANVCFVTDTGECRGREFDGSNSPDPISPPPGSSGSSSSSSGGCDPNDAWCVDNPKRCDWEGYLKTIRDCKELEIPHNYCPYDHTYFEKCICDPSLVACPPPLQGVGASCNGKYRNCKCPDNFKRCECGPAAGAISCTWNGETLYSSCQACCNPYSDETGCYYGTYACSDGCGGTRQCCNQPPEPSSSSSSSGSSGSSSSGSSSGSSSSSSGSSSSSSSSSSGSSSSGSSGSSSSSSGSGIHCQEGYGLVNGECEKCRCYGTYSIDKPNCSPGILLTHSGQSNCQSVTCYECSYWRIARKDCNLNGCRQLSDGRYTPTCKCEQALYDVRSQQIISDRASCLMGEIVSEYEIGMKKAYFNTKEECLSNFDCSVFNGLKTGVVGGWCTVGIEALQ